MVSALLGLAVELHGHHAAAYFRRVVCFLEQLPQVHRGCPPNGAVDAFVQRRSKRALDGAGKDSPPAPSQRELRGLPEEGRFRLRHGLVRRS